MERICKRFFIPRGNTSRYVYIFDFMGSYYRVTLKVLLGIRPYKIVSVVNIPSQYIQQYINTTVALTQ